MFQLGNLKKIDFKIFYHPNPNPNPNHERRNDRKTLFQHHTLRRSTHVIIGGTTIKFLVEGTF